MPPILQVIFAMSACGLQKMVNKINDSVKKRGMREYVRKTKTMVIERCKTTIECDILIESEKVDQVKEFVYLGSLFTNDGKHDRDIARRVNAGNKLMGPCSLL
ncbi:hypothetical protein EVAR_2280_1 [Eumeta japonica]|uniref:Uncharacterized protein n=1 Tax=Eumeta variegata TaxID=151549 RepID=A0A4C1SFQ8_EUMVA|nr:hypothetical protein EVAR_2280_1 [Eumeta japonica]